MADDDALLVKVGRGEALTNNERARYEKLAREISRRGNNIRAWEKGNRKTPN